MVDKTRRNVLVGIGAGSAAVALGGLSIVGADQHEQGNESGDAGTENGDTANVRVAHLSPNAPNVDVFVDDEPVLEDVPFKAVSDYLELPPAPTTSRSHPPARVPTPPFSRRTSRCPRRT